MVFAGRSAEMCSVLSSAKPTREVFEENGIRIYTEYIGKPFRDAHKKPDTVIAKINTDMDYDYLGETVEEILAVIEIKLKNGFAGSNTIYNDYEKLKCYAQELGVSAKLYMATIWEYEDDPTTWKRKMLHGQKADLPN